MNATESQLESAADACEDWERYAAGLVVAAVFCEFLIALLHFSYDSFWERWGSSAANAIITLGIVGEIHFARRNGLIGGELRRRASERVAKAESSLIAVSAKLVRAEAQLDSRRISPEDRANIVNNIKGKIHHKINFVIEKNGKAQAFAWSIVEAIRESGAPLNPFPYWMPPGEKPPCPLMMHCPEGIEPNNDPLYQSLSALRVQFGTTTRTTLSLDFRMPTAMDIGKVVSVFPTGSCLPNNEYIVWVGEQSAFDDQEEYIRRLEKAVGPLRRDV